MESVGRDQESQSNKSRGFREGGKKMYTKHEVNILIRRKLKKAFEGGKKSEQELRTFEKMEVSESEESDQSLYDSDASSKSNYS